MNSTESFDEVMSEKKLPAVAIDKNGLFIMVNRAFEAEFGWTSDDLLGESITTIIPRYLRDAHLIGISRFLVTENATLLGRPIPLKILCKDNEVREAEHYIVGKKDDNGWIFAATIKPVSNSG